MRSCTRYVRSADLLNEVLSLNAQEFVRTAYHPEPISPLLNEVLSLNAQELVHAHSDKRHRTVLNEVLSLNAQEFTMRFAARL